MSNNTFNTDLAAARKVMETTLVRRMDGHRAQALRKFLAAETTAQREDVVDYYAAGYVRRSLREAAVFLEAHNDQDNADVFWALRDDIDPETGDVFTIDTEDLVSA